MFIYFCYQNQPTSLKLAGNSNICCHQRKSSVGKCKNITHATFSVFGGKFKFSPLSTINVDGENEQSAYEVKCMTKKIFHRKWNLREKVGKKFFEVTFRGHDLEVKVTTSTSYRSYTIRPLVTTTPARWRHRR